jgi:hypothetical protein
VFDTGCIQKTPVFIVVSTMWHFQKNNRVVELLRVIYNVFQQFDEVKVDWLVHVDGIASPTIALFKSNVGGAGMIRKPPFDFVSVRFLNIDAKRDAPVLVGCVKEMMRAIDSDGKHVRKKDDVFTLVVARRMFLANVSEMSTHQRGNQNFSFVSFVRRDGERTGWIPNTPTRRAHVGCVRAVRKFQTMETQSSAKLVTAHGERLVVACANKLNVFI